MKKNKNIAKTKITLTCFFCLLISSCTGISGAIIPDALLKQADSIRTITMKKDSITFNYSNAARLKLSLTYNGKIIQTIKEGKGAHHIYEFNINNEKLLSQFKTDYQKNENFCFGLYNHYYKEHVLFNRSKCLDNKPLTNYFDSQPQYNIYSKFKNKLAVHKSKKKKFNSTFEATYYNNKTKSCDIPDIAPINQKLCSNPSKINTMKMSCLKPLGAKACRVAANKLIEQENLDKDKRQFLKYLSSPACDNLVGKKPTFASLADEVGDDLTESDNAVANGVGYLLEGFSLLYTGTEITSCLSSLNIDCDENKRVVHQENIKECKLVVQKVKLQEKQIRNYQSETERLLKEVKKQKALYDKFNHPEKLTHVVRVSNQSYTDSLSTIK